MRRPYGAVSKQTCRYLCLLVSLGTGLQACSAVRCQWTEASLKAPRPGLAPFALPKRLAVGGWAPMPTADVLAPGKPQEANIPHLADVLARVAADFVKLHRNYLVYETRALQQHWAEPCSKRVEGVLFVRALGVQIHGRDTVKLDLAAEIYACHNGALLWRAEGSSIHAAQDSALTQLTDSYVAELGEPSQPYVAPAFGLLQELFADLPDVHLTDDEVSEKIELGLMRREHPVMVAR